jgi:hypothetical protein
MGVVAGPDRAKTFRQAELDQHLKAMTRFVERARETRITPRCALILRSASSTPAHVLTLMKDALLDVGIQAKAVVAKLEPRDDLRKLFATLGALQTADDATALLRWARNPRLLDAHEQVTYGLEMSWSGDAMRRDADKRNAPTLFEDSADAAVRAAYAFEAIWGASVPVPAHYLTARHGKPQGSYAHDPAVPMRTPRVPAHGWPLVRH